MQKVSAVFASFGYEKTFAAHMPAFSAVFSAEMNCGVVRRENTAEHCGCRRFSVTARNGDSKSVLRANLSQIFGARHNLQTVFARICKFGVVLRNSRRIHYRVGSVNKFFVVPVKRAVRTRSLGAVRFRKLSQHSHACAFATNKMNPHTPTLFPSVEKVTSLPF